MESFIPAIIVMLSLSVAAFQVVRNYKYKELTERRHRLLVIVLMVFSALVVADLASGGNGLGVRIVFDLTMVMLPMMLLSSSVWSMSKCLNIVRSFVAIMVLTTLYHLLCLLSLCKGVDTDVYWWGVLGLSLLHVSLFLLGIWYRVRAVRSVMQAGTVWASLSFVVDTIYMVVLLAELLVLMFAGMDSDFVVYMICLLLAGMLAAHGVRICSDSLFVLYHRHERRIVESMKISSVESGTNTQREDSLYKDIYDRVREYFESDKPFLNGDLTINDVVSVVFTNKLYISRAISQYTGRNFCQFVNYHRVMYAVDCFRSNPDLKVTELWPMCGFNTIVSFNMAFRLFMGENPSDWCRKEKIRLSRRVK